MPGRGCKHAFHGCLQQRNIRRPRQPVVAILDQRHPHIIACQPLRDLEAVFPWHHIIALAVEQMDGAFERDRLAQQQVRLSRFPEAAQENLRAIGRLLFQPTGL